MKIKKKWLTLLLTGGILATSVILVPTVVTSCSQSTTTNNNNSTTQNNDKKTLKFNPDLEIATDQLLQDLGLTKSNIKQSINYIQTYTPQPPAKNIKTAESTPNTPSSGDNSSNEQNTTDYTPNIKNWIIHYKNLIFTSDTVNLLTDTMITKAEIKFDASQKGQTPSNMFFVLTLTLEDKSMISTTISGFKATNILILDSNTALPEGATSFFDTFLQKLKEIGPLQIEINAVDYDTNSIVIQALNTALAKANKPSIKEICNQAMKEINDKSNGTYFCIGDFDFATNIKFNVRSGGTNGKCLSIKLANDAGDLIEIPNITAIDPPANATK